jgi:hypothetical protein
MEYKAPDGHIIKSSPNGPVYYSCQQTGMVEGTFFSLETTYANTSIGIQQIQITRVIDADSIDITIKESTNEELIQYQKDVDGGASESEIINNLFNN